MYADARKIHLIEQIVKTDDDRVLERVEQIIAQASSKRSENKEGIGFTPSLTDAEVDEMLQAVDESCGQVNPEDWK